MPRLLETLDDKDRRKNLVADCCTMIDEEVASKGGISGLAIKAGYKLVKGFKPGFVPETVNHLMDDFAKNLQPIVDDADAKGTSVTAFFKANPSRVADALLSITDERAKKSKHGTIKGAYERLRPSAKKNVEEAAPRVGVLIEKYTK
ncbi:MAG: hypothetical protein HY898_28145 [Deltaproteobacteria bacterium]|nr:hypothetical protein [Deltaproteobacteria bacterium]